MMFAIVTIAVHVGSFWIDREPVTNAEMLAFVKVHPEWQRDRVKPVMADPTYLQRWAAPLELGPKAPPQAPAVDVSWFAARAFCAWRGGRLPTEAEWELAAGESDDIAWYEQPTPAVQPDVGGAPNEYGISDMHGLVWEWVEDFTATILDPAGCGVTTTTIDPRKYGNYMRAAFRSSLKGSYTTPNLGFRCAY